MTTATRWRVLRDALPRPTDVLGEVTAAVRSTAQQLAIAAYGVRVIVRRVTLSRADRQQRLEQLDVFLREQCELVDGFRSPAAVLYAAYEAWAQARATPPLSQTAFGRALTARGVYPEKFGPGKTILRVGIRLRTVTKLMTGPENRRAEGTAR